MSLGGSAGTTIGTAAMRALPVGIFPKLMVSTLAQRQGAAGRLACMRDVMMMYSVVDISGIIGSVGRCSITRRGRWWGRSSSKFQVPSSKLEDNPRGTATMFGVTTPCVEAGRDYLRPRGMRCWSFMPPKQCGRVEAHSRRAVSLGCSHITTTELADELAGGVLGRVRIGSRPLCGGRCRKLFGRALDMVNFGPPETVPEKYKPRRFHQHNPTVTLMRTTPDR